MFRTFITEVLDQLQNTGRAELSSALEKSAIEIKKWKDLAGVRVDELSAAHCKLLRVEMDVKIKDRYFKVFDSIENGMCSNDSIFLDSLQMLTCKKLELYVANPDLKIFNKKKIEENMN